ncbi:MAG: hypothetical protein RSA48_02070 [Bacilli bacterium]
MKYRITGINPQEVIKTYVICKDKIKVKYLKGSATLPNNEKVQAELDDTMLKQMQSFINQTPTNYTISAESVFKSFFTDISISLGIGAIGVIDYNPYNISKFSAFFITAGVLLQALTVGTTLYNMFLLSEASNYKLDLIKYRDLLDNYSAYLQTDVRSTINLDETDRFSKSTWLKLNKEGAVNFNNIDKFSFSDMITIREQIANSNINDDFKVPISDQNIKRYKKELHI